MVPVPYNRTVCIQCELIFFKVEVFDEDNTSDKLIGAAQLSLNDFKV
jgi:hypothetical protein